MNGRLHHFLCSMCNYSREVVKPPTPGNICVGTCPSCDYPIEWRLGGLLRRACAQAQLRPGSLGTAHACETSKVMPKKGGYKAR